MNTNFTHREQIIETVNKLFIYTDAQDWGKLLKEVFTEKVLFDVTSLGAEQVETHTAMHICDMWMEGFKGLDAIHHQAGNYIVEIEDNTAKVFACAIASHYKETAIKGKTREFVGSYNIELKRLEKGWRISMFKYNLKYIAGNLDMK